MASFPTDTYTGSNLANLIPTIWSPKMNDFYKQAQVVSSFFTDLSSELTDGGKTIQWPVLTEMTASIKANATPVTLNSATYDKVSLTVDTWYEVSFAIEDKEAAQVMRSYMLQEKLAKNAAYTVANKLEDAILALFAGFTQTVGASTTSIADSDIRGAIAKLDSNNVPKEDRCFFFDPAVFWTQIYALDRFVSRDFTNAMPVDNGFTGLLYSIPCKTTNRIPYVNTTTGRTNALVHKDAIVFATHNLGGQGKFRLQSNYIPQYLSTLVTADIVYGVAKNRDKSGVLIYTKA